MPSYLIKTILLITIVLLLCLPLWLPQKENKIERYWELWKWNAGEMQVIAYSKHSNQQLQEIMNTAWKEIERLDTIINEYDTNSHAGKLRIALEKGESPLTILPELWNLLQFAQSISNKTNGAFDISVGPLIQLWKQCRNENRFPNQQEISNIRSKIGYQQILLSPPDQVSLKDNTLRSINLGAFSKGYAVDQVIAFLQKQGISDGMINMGGDLRCFGERKWKIGIQDPRIQHAEDPEIVLGVIEVSNLAVATSGHYRRYIEIEGKRYSHIMDPNTLWPVKNQIVSVTVLAPNAMLADAYATAFCILPIDSSLKIAEQNNLNFCIITQNGEKYELHTTPQFEQYWQTKPIW